MTYRRTLIATRAGIDNAIEGDGDEEEGVGNFQGLRWQNLCSGGVHPYPPCDGNSLFLLNEPDFENLAYPHQWHLLDACLY